MSIESRPFGTLLAIFRGDATQRSIAKQIGCSQQLVGQWESEDKFPSYDMLIVLADVLKLTKLQEQQLRNALDLAKLQRSERNVRTRNEAVQKAIQRRNQSHTLTAQLAVNDTASTSLDASNRLVRLLREALDVAVSEYPKARFEIDQREGTVEWTYLPYYPDPNPWQEFFDNEVLSMNSSGEARLSSDDLDFRLVSDDLDFWLDFDGNKSRAVAYDFPLNNIKANKTRIMVLSFKRLKQDRGRVAQAQRVVEWMIDRGFNVPVVNGDCIPFGIQTDFGIIDNRYVIAFSEGRRPSEGLKWSSEAHDIAEANEHWNILMKYPKWDSSRSFETFSSLLSKRG